MFQLKRLLPSYSSSKPQLETPPELDTPGGENVEVNTGRIYLEFTVEEQLLFERRYEEGYDVCDDRYSAWLVQERGLSPCSSMIMCPQVDIPSLSDHPLSLDPTIKTPPSSSPPVSSYIDCSHYYFTYS